MMQEGIYGFTLYNRVFREARNWKWVAAVLFVLLAVQTERLHEAGKRHTVLKAGCALGEAPQVFKTEDLDNPKADRNEARNFLYHMVQWRLGWSSSTVLRDMQAYLQQCYHTQRIKDLAYLEDLVPSRTDVSKKIKRKDDLVAQDVRNWPSDREHVIFGHVAR